MTIGRSYYCYGVEFLFFAAQGRTKMLRKRLPPSAAVRLRTPTGRVYNLPARCVVYDVLGTRFTVSCFACRIASRGRLYHSATAAATATAPSGWPSTGGEAATTSIVRLRAR